jgi:hypothetical protein
MSATAERVSGRCYALEANELGQTLAQFTFSETGSTLRLAAARGRSWSFPAAVWGCRAKSADSATLAGKVAAAGAWTADDTYVSQIWAHETPFRVTVRAVSRATR